MAISSLVVRGLKKSYGARQVVRDVSLEVESGEVVGLLGPNGAGKTTSFYMIVGLVPSDGGEIDLTVRPFRACRFTSALRSACRTCRRKPRCFAS